MKKGLTIYESETARNSILKNLIEMDRQEHVESFRLVRKTFQKLKLKQFEVIR